jgi:hypothetical protein
MRFEDLSWFDVEKYLKDEDRLMLVLGACEQHGYLSLLSDTKIPLALADAASQKTGLVHQVITASHHTRGVPVRCLRDDFLDLVEDAQDCLPPGIQAHSHPKRSRRKRSCAQAL